MVSTGQESLIDSSLGHSWSGGYVNITGQSERGSVVSLCDPMDYTVHGILQAGILE